MALVLCLADLVLPASDDQPFVKLVLMIESAVPSADTIIVVVQQAEKYTTAEALAACYLLQYIFGGPLRFKFYRASHISTPTVQPTALTPNPVSMRGVSYCRSQLVLNLAPSGLHFSGMLPLGAAIAISMNSFEFD